MMTRAQRRASKRHGQRLQKLEWNQFDEITDSAYQTALKLGGNPNYKPHKVYKNNRYLVQCFNDQEILGFKAIQCLIRRNDGKAIYNWPELQRLKNELFGAETEAVQIFPKESSLIDAAHLYWMWILGSIK